MKSDSLKSLIRRSFRPTLWLLVLIYLLLPLFAGAFKWGERTGPVIYLRSYHATAYRIGYSSAGHGKPRISFMDSILTRRPFFYGMRPRPISESEFHEIYSSKVKSGALDLAQMIKEAYEELKKPDTLR